MKLDNKNIFSEIERIIITSCNILKKQNEILKSNNVYTKQRKIDLKQGFVRTPGGLLVYLKDIQHRIIFDSYEIHAIEEFVTLCKEVLNNIDSSIVQFPLRTLLEISFDKIKILFAKSLPVEQKNKYKAVCLLADYGFMIDSGHSNDYDRLLSDFEGIFTKNQISLLKDLRKRAINSEERRDLVKKLRLLVGGIQDELSKSIKLSQIFDVNKIESLNSTYSHILHGDFILISTLFMSKRMMSNKLRVYVTLLLSAVNGLICVSECIVDSEELTKIAQIKEDYIIVTEYLNKHWEEFEPMV